MKKFFAFVAAALVAFSFTSCDPNSPESNGFKITVSNIAATTASVAVEPTDAEATYYWGVAESAELAKLSDDSLKSQVIAMINYYIEAYAALGSELTYDDFLSKGNDAYDYEGLTPNTEYTVYAFKLDANGVAKGNVAKKAFKSLEVVVSETVALDLVGEYSYYADYGVLQIIGEDAAKGLELGLALYAAQPSGSFTLDDCYEDGYYYWNYIYNTATEDIAEFLELSVNGTLGNDGIYTFSGYAIAETGVKYTFANVQATEYVEEGDEEGEGDGEVAAPKRARAHKAAPAFNKHMMLKK